MAGSALGLGALPELLDGCPCLGGVSGLQHGIFCETQSALRLKGKLVASQHVPNAHRQAFHVS